MKRFILILCSLLALSVSAQDRKITRQSTQKTTTTKVTTSKKSSSSKSTSHSSGKSSNSSSSSSKGPKVSYEPRGYVDLGLPSGTLWANCNVGASSPEKYGDYFAWGETTPQSSQKYDLLSYKYCRGSYNTMTEYCYDSSYGTVDNRYVLESMDDAATANWGSDWRMPTKDQFEELINSSYTKTSWTTLNGIYGRMIVSKMPGHVGTAIFLPAAGYRGNGSLIIAGSLGNYWSRSLYTSASCSAYGLYFLSSDIGADSYGGRDYGQSVRPVRVAKN